MNLLSMLLFVSALSLVSSAAAIPTSPDVTVALAEMQKADYYAFVMLINMAPPDFFQANITFLMPNDRSLAGLTNLGEIPVTDFLLRHSIPWPLLFDNMMHFPSGSLIPSSRPGLVLKVTNDGRRRFFYNNVRIISPNVCIKAASIRCHGIDAVVVSNEAYHDCSRCPQWGAPPTITPPSLPPHPPPMESNGTSVVAVPSQPSVEGGGSPIPPPLDGDMPSQASSSCSLKAAGVVVCIVTIIFFFVL